MALETPASQNFTFSAAWVAILASLVSRVKLTIGAGAQGLTSISVVVKSSRVALAGSLRLIENVGRLAQSAEVRFTTGIATRGTIVASVLIRVPSSLGWAPALIVLCVVFECRLAVRADTSQISCSRTILLCLLALTILVGVPTITAGALAERRVVQRESRLA